MMLASSLGAYLMSPRFVCSRGPRDSLRGDMQTVRSATVCYLGMNPDASCPTVVDLFASGALDRNRRVIDAWNHPFRIVCDGEDIRVISAGPDGVFDGIDIE
jgi:hypothetical protein